MQEIGLYKARTRWSELMRRVARGERFTITRHGAPLAVLAPAAANEPDRIREAVRALHAFRKGKRLGRLKLRDLIKEGRKS
ncbi:MAG: type II toxin-antitoxin system prevent-host-death family antitoxin [Candidatus Binataceae bacterium]